MTTDLWMLLAAAALHWALILIVAVPMILNNGWPWAFGNREETPEPTGWLGRASRCSANLLENLPVFTILVLVAHVSGTADGNTALGAQVFVGARVLHAGAYLAGIHYVRTGLWAVSLVGWAIIVVGIVS